MNAVQRVKSKGGVVVASETMFGQTGALATCSAEISKPSASTVMELHGVPIHFPFEPYPCQKDYMASVIRALNLSENALLESPTGTGKTLCLLCSTLAWQCQNARGQAAAPLLEAGTTPAPPPMRNTIVYASRTHSQLSQVVKELKNTRYRPKHTVVASREQLCVHEKVSKMSTSAAINNECTKLNKERKCRFRNNLERFGGPSKLDNSEEPPILDVEELRVMGKTHNICPFYFARDSVKDCDLVLVPYNYLFDKEARTTLDIQWNNAILIFDEAHNLESFASDATSFDLTGLDIAVAINEVSRGIEVVSNNLATYGNEDGVKVDNLVKLKAMLLRIEEFLDRHIPVGGGSFEGEYIFEVWRYASITYQNHQLLIEFIRRISEIIMQAHGGMSSGTPKLDHLLSCIKRAFAGTSEAQCLAKAGSYRVHVTPNKKSTGNYSSTTNKKEPRTLSYWCFAPSLAMRELADLGLRSIIVTSGTLSPIKSYSLTLGIPFHITLENPHIIKSNQVHIRVIGRGVSQQLLKSTFERRDDKDYLTELGNTLVALSRVIPGGMLIFYPSYSVMEKCIDEWGGPEGRKWSDGGHKKNNFFAARPGNKAASTTGSFSFPQVANHYHQEQGKSLTIWKRLLSLKAIVLEPRSTSEMKEAISEFDKYIDIRGSKGCILMGVCRGKISEGIDFADNRARAVIITGIPFPPFQDPKVRLKREFLDGSISKARVKPTGDGGFSDIALPTTKTSNSDMADAQSISGAEWYSQQALRAVNQAVGRVIRHRFDYGAVLLLDSRFGEPRNQDGFSKWARPHIQPDEGFGTAIFNLAKFYRDAISDPVLTKCIAPRNVTGTSESTTNSKNIPILRYEDNIKSRNDAVMMDDEEVANINITVVQAATQKDDDEGSHCSDSNGGEALHRDGYIPANRVIKRIEVKKKDLLTKKSVQNNFDCSTGSKCSNSSGGSGLNALFKHPSMNSSTRTDQIPPKTSTSGSMFWEYLEHEKSSSTAAKGLIVRIPSVFNTTIASTKNLGHVKPMTVSNPIESKDAAISFFKAAQCCMTIEDFQILRLSVAKLKEMGDKNDFHAYLMVAREMLQLLLQYDDKNDLVLLLMPLLPPKQRSAMQAIALELRAVARARKFKDSQSSYQGEKTIQSALFRTENPTLKTAIRSEVAMQDSKEHRHEKQLGLLKAQNVAETAKKRVHEGANGIFQRSAAAQRGHKLSNALKSSTENIILTSRDPSKKKKGGVNQSKQLQDIQDKQNCSSDADFDVAQCIQQVSAVSYLTDYGKDSRLLKPRIRSNTPKALICTICEVPMRKPMAAECNHYACKHCWQKWLVLAQNSTCPICRKPANISTLSLVVFEKQTGAGVPSLSQLRSDDFSSDDDSS